MSHPQTNTFLFADLAGFTAMTEAMGDRSAADIAEEFCAEAGALASQLGAEVVKPIGDAVMLRVAEASAAVELGLRIVGEIGERHYFPTIRAGMHTGPAIKRNGDWFGTSVNVAARVSAEASGREVLLTSATRDAAPAIAGVELRPRGRRTLRNVSEPVELYAAVREAVGADASLPIDPVCRMAVDPEHSAGRLQHGGFEHQFCSLECAGRFAADPGRYLTSPTGAGGPDAGKG